jgi:NB-ARC domain
VGEYPPFLNNTTGDERKETIWQVADVTFCPVIFLPFYHISADIIWKHLAVEYAYQFSEHYHDVLWASADSREILALSYVNLARALRLRDQAEHEQQKVVEAVKCWLRDHKGWLLILDNVEDLSLVREFLPTVQQGSVVLTTRRGETAPIAEALTLDVLSEEEGIRFLLKRAGFITPDADFAMIPLPHKEGARAIVRVLGGLPLALDQAGAYLAESKCRLSHYLSLLSQQQAALLQRRGLISDDHPLSVATTFSLVFEQVRAANQAAIELLQCCAFLQPDAIPEELLSEGAAHLGSGLQRLGRDGQCALHTWCSRTFSSTSPVFMILTS